ncbi:MAG: hypothetical protein ACE5G8_08710, partial [Anaerolineae bacterium]
MTFAGIATNKRHFTDPAGRPFFVMGANYEGYFDRAWHMWDDNRFDPGLIENDFKKMAHIGLNVVRLFVLPALEADARAGKFTKLDKVLQLAADHNLLVLLTFNDSHSLNLAEAAAVDAKIAHRYRDDPVILGWDLENEPVFYNFVAAVYPPSRPAPVQTAALVDHYGARVSQQEALELQRQRRIPAHLSPPLAFYYINALKLFIEFSADATAWARAQGATLVEYIYSNDSATWHKFIEVMNGTVAAWLDARRTPVRSADPNHLITVGYNWLQFAGLPANRVLDFQEFHKYGSASLFNLNQITQALTSLQKAFPKHPVVMGEFGYSNHTTTNPATSRPVDGDLTALFEGAQLAFMRANRFAGGLKWMLNDVDTKPIRDLLARFSRHWPALPTAGAFKRVQDRLGLAFRLDLGRRITLGGGVFQDETFSWQADEFGYCFIKLARHGIDMTAQGTGHLALDPWEIVPGWEPGRQSVLYRLVNDSLVEVATFLPQQRAAWNVVSGATYRLAMGAAVEPPSPEEPDIVPNPGEHALLLPNADDALRPALPYIQTFAPDITFAPQAAAGRWAYVTV